MKNDQRRNSRLACEGTAEFFLLPGPSASLATVVDISLEGCRVVLQEAAGTPVGTVVEVAFSINNLAFRMRGQVRAIQSETVVGLQFDSVSERARRQIEELVEELTAEWKKREANRAMTQRGRVTAEAIPESIVLDLMSMIRSRHRS